MSAIAPDGGGYSAHLKTLGVLGGAGVMVAFYAAYRDERARGWILLDLLPLSAHVLRSRPLLHGASPADPM